MTLSWQRVATGAPAGRSQRWPLRILDTFPGGGRGRLCPGAELVISHLNQQQLEDIRGIQWAECSVGT